MSSTASLPISSLLPEVIAAMREPGSVAVIEAPPGAGKTTAVPPALLDAGIAGAGEILVLQPRRLAARVAASWIAQQYGEQVGQRVGYQVRLDAKRSAATRICFLTEGLLVRRLLGDNELRGVSVVILDEFHERNLDTDVCLTSLLHLRATSRPDLRLIVMSATLDAAGIGAFLEAPVLTSQGRAFPVEVEYSGQHETDLQALAKQVSGALRDVLAQQSHGHILVFLPGMRAIRMVAQAVESLAARHAIVCHTLHGSLSRDEQDAAVSGHGPRKLILATNVAETSVTIDGVTAVVDSGLVHRATQDAANGFVRVRLEKISQASAIQRAGRAGRTAPGICIRLYTKNDFDRRASFDAPEIVRADLLPVRLAVASLVAGDVARLRWLDAPPVAAWSSAENLLRELSALSESGELTAQGREMLRFPIHPRLARVMVQGREFGVGKLTAWVCACLSETGLRRGARERVAINHHDADVFVDLEELRRCRDPEAARRCGLDWWSVMQAQALARSLMQDVENTGSSMSREEEERLVRMALLAGFPDRVGKVRPPTKEFPHRSVALAGGGQAILSERSAVGDASWIIATEIEESQIGTRRETKVSSAVAIEPEWLMELWFERLEEVEVVTYDATRDRVVARAELRYAGLLVETTARPVQSQEAARVLLREIRAKGLALALGEEVAETLAQLQSRTAFVHAYDASFQRLDDEGLDELLVTACIGKDSLASVRRVDWHGAVWQALGEEAAKLDKLAPTSVRLPGGRSLKLSYEGDRAPGCASRLQDFFGMHKGPTVMQGRVAVRLHLLAPNRRDVQVTTDLAGFWDRHYPELRRALMRRYPRHSWPEDPHGPIPPPEAKPRSKSSR